jgi:hypothetical protein
MTEIIYRYRRSGWYDDAGRALRDASGSPVRYDEAPGDHRVVAVALSLLPDALLDTGFGKPLLLGNLEIETLHQLSAAMATEGVYARLWASAEGDAA